jgi:malonyl-CoA/methylmalonyl-CoA synthetase
VGPPLPGVGVRVRDDKGEPLAAGEIGGIEVKGPNVFKGYWRMPEKTADEFTTDLWFKTGDVGRSTADGYVTIVGRSKDLIISGGYNVYPAEIEGCINDMPGVAESAVVGVPHPDFGEAVVAVVVPKPGAALRRKAMPATLKARSPTSRCPSGVRGARPAAQHHGQGAEEPAARPAQGAVRTLPPALLAQLQQRYTGCLCLECLRALAAGPEHAP